MSFSVGIIGFPNAGKSTLFKALTKQKVLIEPRPFSTVNPNVGIVPLPDKRLEKIAKTVNPEKVTPTTIEFWDIAGLVKDAHKGEGLGNKFLSQIRNCDALLEVIRVFDSKKVPHPEKKVDPNRDFEVIKMELLMKDLETVEKALAKLEKNKRDEKKRELLARIKKELEKGNTIKDLSPEEEKMVKEFQFLTKKPKIYILNKGEKNKELEKEIETSLKLNLKLEEEIAELEKEEVKELELSSRLPWIISACYEALDLVTFYTIAGGKEARAWTLKRGQTAPEAGGVVHSDFEEKFIRAEVVNWKELIEAGGFKEAKEKGLVETVGRDYQVKDGDVIEFKI